MAPLMIKTDELLLALTGRRPQIAVMENLFIKSKNKQNKAKKSLSAAAKVSVNVCGIAIARLAVMLFSRTNAH